MQTNQPQNQPEVDSGFTECQNLASFFSFVHDCDGPAQVAALGSPISREVQRSAEEKRAKDKLARKNRSSTSEAVVNAGRGGGYIGAKSQKQLDKEKGRRELVKRLQGKIDKRLGRGKKEVKAEWIAATEGWTEEEQEALACHLIRTRAHYSAIAKHSLSFAQFCERSAKNGKAVLPISAPLPKEVINAGPSVSRQASTPPLSSTRSIRSEISPPQTVLVTPPTDTSALPVSFPDMGPFPVCNLDQDAYRYMARSLDGQYVPSLLELRQQYGVEQVRFPGLADEVSLSPQPIEEGYAAFTLLYRTEEGGIFQGFFTHRGRGQ